MGLQLSWNNIALLASPNVLAVRAWQRQKIIGGTYYTTGFLPANDLAPSLFSTEFIAAVVNKVYEFKVESICSSGGPSENTNGIQEGMVFGCLTLTSIPVASATDSWSGVINVTATDLQGVKFTLKKQADDTVVGLVQDIPQVAGICQIDYTGLDSATAYYVEAIMYATVNGVQVEYLCGGNVAGYQFTTDVAP